MLRAVQLTSKAKSDLVRFEESISSKISARAAGRWLKKLSSAIMDLERSAESFPEADEASILALDLRMRIVGNKSHVYRVIFEILDDRVVVYRVRHAEQRELTDSDL